MVEETSDGRASSYRKDFGVAERFEPRGDAGLVTRLAAAIALAVSVVHWGQLPDHFAKQFYLGILFIIGATALLDTTFALIVRPMLVRLADRCGHDGRHVRRWHPQPDNRTTRGHVPQMGSPADRVADLGSRFLGTVGGRAFRDPHRGHTAIRRAARVTTPSPARPS